MPLDSLYISFAVSQLDAVDTSSQVKQREVPCTRTAIQRPIRYRNGLGISERQPRKSKIAPLNTFISNSP